MLANKIPLVTGATGALGRVVVEMLLERNVKVVASYRTEQRLKELLEFVGKLSVNLTGIKADVTDAESVKNLVQKAVEEHGRVDILLNISGAYAGGNDIASTEESQWDFMMNTKPQVCLSMFKSCASIHDSEQLWQNSQHRLVDCCHK